MFNKRDLFKEKIKQYDIVVVYDMYTTLYINRYTILQYIYNVPSTYEPK